MKKLAVTIVATSIFAGCAQTENVSESSLQPQLPLTGEGVTILKNVEGKTYVLRGSPFRGGTVGLLDERRISFGPGGSAKYYFTNHHGYYLQACDGAGWTVARLTVSDGRINIEAVPKNMAMCQESWSFELSSDASKLVTSNGIVFTRQ
jgi:hypothetical protein